MPFRFNTGNIIFCTTILLVVFQSSHQYTYSCNSNATCGCSSNPASVSRIVGGESARSSTWDWAVSLSITTGIRSALCGGAILSSTWIITAAHCMTGVSASQVTVYAGSNTRFSGQSQVAFRVIVHPNYVSSTKLNDIALIQLSTPLTMTSAVKTICIPSVDLSTSAAGEWPSPNLYVVAIGWGSLYEDGSSSTSLRQVTLQTIAYNAAMCRLVLYDRQLQMCAGVYGGGKDTCQGDSGGPLMMYTASQQWMLVGVTSYGDGCGRERSAGVYTRVAAYQSWISAMTSNAYTKPISSESANINTPSVTILSSTTRKSTVSSSGKEIALISHILFLLVFLIFTTFSSL